MEMILLALFFFASPPHPQQARRAYEFLGWPLWFIFLLKKAQWEL